MDMLIENYIIRDIVLSELTNEPLDQESQEVIDLFDGVFNSIHKVGVSDRYVIWVDSEGKYLFTYFTEKEEIHILDDLFKYFTHGVEVYSDFDDSLLIFLFEKYLNVTIRSIVSKKIISKTTLPNWEHIF